MFQVIRLDAQQRLRCSDQFLVHHIHGNARCGKPGALAVARLQHVQLVLLDRELHVLHVPVVLLQVPVDLHQLGKALGHILFQRGILLPPVPIRDSGV